MLEQIQELVQKEIENKNNELLEEIEYLQAELKKEKSKNLTFKEQNKELSEKQKQYKTLIDLSSNVSLKTVRSLMDSTYKKSAKINSHEQGSRELPQVFMLLCDYYDNRKELFEILDGFNISYPEWYKNIKLPYDYNREEIKFVLENSSRLSMYNGCYFDHNMEYYYEWLQRVKGELKLDYSNSIMIPINLLLQNKLLQEDEFFEAILNEISKDYGFHKFLLLPNYQEVSYDRKKELIQNTSPRIYKDTLSSFFNYSSEVLCDIDIAEHYKEKINNNSYSIFHYSKYNNKIQVEYFINLIKEVKNGNTKNLDYNSNIFSMIDKSSLTNKLKKELAEKAVRELY